MTKVVPFTKPAGFKLDETTVAQLNHLAGMLPLVMVNTHEKHIYTKEELDDMGWVGAEKMEDGKYLVKMPVQIAKNHFRCMKRRFLRGGSKAVSAYIDEIKALPNA